MSEKHKNSNDAKGNFVIYSLSIDDELEKYGKSDADRITKTPFNIPTRIHQQVRKLLGLGKNVSYKILEYLFGVTTKDAKEVEQNYIDDYIKKYGQKPKGNK